MFDFNLFSIPSINGGDAFITGGVVSFGGFFIES